MHRLFINFGIELGIIVDGCLITFPFAHATCTNLKTSCYKEFIFLYRSEKHQFHDVYDFCSLPVLAMIMDACWYRFGFHFRVISCFFFEIDVCLFMGDLSLDLYGFLKKMAARNASILVYKCILSAGGGLWDSPWIS